MRKINIRLWRRLKQTKGQFAAIVGLVAIGILAYVTMNMAIINLENSLYLYYSDQNFADLFAEVVRIPESKVDILEKAEGIKLVEGRITQDILMKTDDESKVKLRLISEKENGHINKLYYNDGGPIKNTRRDILVIKQFANARNIAVGDEMEISLSGKTYKFYVKGIVSSPEFVYLMESEQSMMPMPDQFGIVYLNEEIVQELLGYGDYYNELVMKVQAGRDLDYTKEKFEHKIEKYGLKRLFTMKDQLSHNMVNEEIQGVKKTANVVPIIFLGAAAMTIALMISRIVKNDRMSIGVMKALGYTNIEILMHYTAYSLIIGIVGAMVGILIGTPLSGAYAEMYKEFFDIPYLKIVIYYNYAFLGILLSGAFCVVSGVMGARRIVQIAPAESMRPEAPKKAHAIYIDKINGIWKHLSFSWKMVMRNMLRSKKRFLFIIFGIALSFANILFILNMISSVYVLFDLQFEEYQQIDYVVNFTQPIHERAVLQIDELIDAKNIEARVEYPYNLKSKWRDKVVNVIGVKANTPFYNLQTLGGKRVQIESGGIYLSEALAKKLRVGIGDKITIESFLPEREDLDIRVKAIVEQALGANAYMEIKDMQKTLVDPQMITSVMVNSKDDVKDKLEDVKNIMNVQSDDDYKDMFDQFLGLMITSTTIMVIMAGFIGFAIIYSSTVVNINERRLELASLRILGFSKDGLYKIMKKENYIMATLGLILGVPMGNAMSEAVMTAFSTELYTMKVYFDFRVYVVSAVLTLMFIALAQGFAKRKIHHINFIEALKNRMT
ncbi:MAG: ABC transporter permease [Tissierellales bacterium]|jgi:putative ABC transport system permease protein|nr:ABC transporter permease [Tissierellales bacterium]